jgi:hypothetical protein
MRWAWAKILTLAGAAVAASGAALSAQGPAFAQAYLQRLGGHIDEARRTLDELSGGAAARIVADGATRERLVGAFAERVGELEASRAAIADAHPLWQPLALALHADDEIARATADVFTPAMPLDLPSLVYAAVGLGIGWMVWEFAQWPCKARWQRLRASRKTRTVADA